VAAEGPDGLSGRYNLPIDPVEMKGREKPMKPKEPERLHPSIDPKLAALARSSPMPPWHDAWSRLGPQSTHEERLKVCQAIRDAGTLPEDAGYFLVCWAAEHVAEEEDARRSDPLQTMNNFEGVRASERTFAALLERCGEVGMADLFRTDLEGHDRRREAGRLFFFGPAEDEEGDDPEWLDNLLRAVAGSVVASNPVESLAYRYLPGPFVQEAHICPPAGSGWAVDIEKLREAFGKIDGCGWYAVTAEEGRSPYFWIEGEFDDREVFLRVLPAGEIGKGYETWARARK
jgi:hypothetical protein